MWSFQSFYTMLITTVGFVVVNVHVFLAKGCTRSCRFTPSRVSFFSVPSHVLVSAGCTRLCRFTPFRLYICRVCCGSRSFPPLDRVYPIVSFTPFRPSFVFYTFPRLLFRGLYPLVSFLTFSTSVGFFLYLLMSSFPQMVMYPIVSFPSL